jgi:predicted deacetylase
MRVYVCIHDVTPALAHSVERAFTLCHSLGLKPALLVVPNWHGAWPLDQHPRFVDWLRKCVLGGSDVLLHGYRHDEAGLERTLRHRAQAWGRTDSEGEFLTLDRAAARQRIGAGLDMLRKLGLAPLGFVPPAWLAQEGTLAAAAESGLDLYEDGNSMRLLPQRRSLPSPVFRWSARTPLRAFGSALVAEARWLTQRRAPRLRVAIHPPDVLQPRTAYSVATTLLRLCDSGANGRYRDLVPPRGQALSPDLGAYALEASR